MQKKKTNKVYRLRNEKLGISSLPEGIEITSENQYVVNRNYLADQFKSSGFYKQVLIDKNEEGGFEFKGIKPDGLFDHLGFRIGDVISEINGNKINSFMDIVIMQDDLVNNNELTVTVLRDKNPHYIQYILD